MITTIEIKNVISFEEFWKNEGKKQFMNTEVILNLEYSFALTDKKIIDKIFNKDFVNGSVAHSLK